jgi:galactokinase
MRRVVMGMLLPLMVAVLVVTIVPQGYAADDAVAATKASKKALRLPPYYGDVIDKEQRDKIGAIYSDYNERLANLRKQVKALAAERERALESQLSDAQKAKLDKLRAEAKAKGAKMADDE